MAAPATQPGRLTRTARLGVMLSGSGRTLLNLLEAIRAGRLRAEVALVIASRECPGAQRAREAGLTVVVRPGVGGGGGVIPRDELGALLREHRIDWLVLAGYLKLVEIPPEFRERCVNIHPALLPRHGGPGMYGERVHEAVLRAGDPVSGCTVHLCDEVYDRGRILLQKTCPVLPGDTPETLAARVFALECEAYPEALAALIGGGESHGARTDV